MNNRNLWQDVKAQGDEERRKMIGLGGRVLYGFFIVIGGLLAFDLYTRPDSTLLKIFGIFAAIGLVVSDVFWAWATHHSAAGVQRLIARVFWASGVTIYTLNVVSEYQHYLGTVMSDLTKAWYQSASIATVVVAVVGWALYSMFSPEQKISDVSAQAKSNAVKALLRGVENPTPEAIEAFNIRIEQASHDLAEHAAGVVSGHVSGMIMASAMSPIQSGNGHNRPALVALNATGAKVPKE